MTQDLGYAINHFLLKFLDIAINSLWVEQDNVGMLIMNSICEGFVERIGRDSDWNSIGRGYKAESVILDLAPLVCPEAFLVLRGIGSTL